MKVVVIGCTHAGTAAVKTLLKRNPDTEVTIYERNDNVSFLSCGIALYVGGAIKDKNGLFYSSPEELASLGAKTRMQCEVTNVDLENKKVAIKDLVTEEEFTDTFDKLIIASGSWPIIPRIEGIHSKNVKLSKNFHHANEIIEESKVAKKITIVGAGYIGVELAEAFSHQGKEVVLIDALDRIMPKYLDPEFTDIAEEAFRKHGVKLALGQKVSSFVVENNLVTKVVTDKEEFATDMVVMCIGFRPNTALFKDQIKMAPNGAIEVNEYMQTSNPDVYACGDAILQKYNPVGDLRYIPLATNAIRSGTLVGMNLYGNKQKSPGIQGTSGIQIYENSLASTGLNETVCKEMNLNYEAVSITELDKPAFMPEATNVLLKILFEKDTRRILGGQVCSTVNQTELMNVLSVVIEQRMTMEDLAFVDFFFQPNFNQPWNLLNRAALKVVL